MWPAVWLDHSGGVVLRHILVSRGAGGLLDGLLCLGGVGLDQDLEDVVGRRAYWIWIMKAIV